MSSGLPIPFCKFLPVVIRVADGIMFRRAGDYTYGMPKMRIANAHKKSMECMRSQYERLTDPSPFKLAACVCAGIIQEQIFLLKGFSDKIPKEKAEQTTLCDNVRLAVTSGLLSLNEASFKCAVDVKPPFDLNFPSRHFTFELIEGLAENRIDVASLALIYEQIFYASSKGCLIRGRIDSSLPE